MNPGPTVTEQLAAILDNQKVSSNELRSMRESLECHVAETNRRLASIEEKLLSFPETVQKVEDCERLVSKLNNQTAFLLKKWMILKIEIDEIT